MTALPLNVDSLVSLAGLPSLPPQELNPVLDAAARCFVRYGVRRTSVQDIAADLGVNRTTVYRQAGTIDQIARMLMVRDSYRLLVAMFPHFTGREGPEAVVELVARAVDEARKHPVLAKMLADESDVIGSLASNQLPALIDPAIDGVAPLIALLMQGGRIADGDPKILAEWLLRIGVTLILVPPRSDSREFLRAVLMPVLTSAKP